MRIHKPHSSGKIILTYAGSRVNLQQIRSKYFKIRALGSEELIEGIKERLLVKVKLFDNNEIALGLISNKLYTSSKIENKIIWYQDEESYPMIYNIIIDDKLAIFKGSFVINFPYNDDFLEERYNFTMIFSPSDEIRHHLTTNNVTFENY